MKLKHFFGEISHRLLTIFTFIFLFSFSTSFAQVSLLSFSNVANTVSTCDDCAQQIDITGVFEHGVNFGGTVYTNNVYIGSNGYLTFGHANTGFSPLGIAGYTTGPIIAGQYDDLDANKGGTIYYDQNSGAGYIVVTFYQLAPYSSPHYGSGTISFQIVLRKLGTYSAATPDFQIEVRYNNIGWWQSGNISSPPTAGWSTGTGTTYAEMPYSGSTSFGSNQTSSNVGTGGLYRWDVLGGTVLAAPTVNQTTSPTSITVSSAVSGGNISSDGGASVTQHGIVWSTSTMPTLASHTAGGYTTHGSVSSIPHSFSSNCTGLNHSTTYYVRAYATNSEGTAYGPQQTFSTLTISPPSITTNSVSNILRNSATSGGNISNTNGASVTQHGIVWSTSSNPTLGSHAGGNFTSLGATGTGSFSSNMTSLTQGTTYYVRAYATNIAGTNYGIQRVFTTFPVPPTLNATTAAGSITSRTATSGGNISADGDESITQHGIVWSTSSNPTLGSHTGGSYTSQGAVGSVPHSFTSNLTGLTKSTTYHIRSYATNSEGTGYGPNVSFTTLDNSPPTVNNESYFVYAGTSRSVTSPTLLDNDSDPDPGDVMTITNTGSQATTLGGTVNISSTGTFSYTPAANHNPGDNDTFNYTVSDGTESNTGTCTINIVNAIFTGTSSNTTAGNWNGGYVPPMDSDMDVIFQTGVITITSSMIVRNLTIYNAASFICTGGATITVNGSVGNENRIGVTTNSPIIYSTGFKVND